MSYILAINVSHDSSSCLLKDGEVIYYNEESRFNRIKHYSILDDWENKFRVPSLYKVKNHTDVIDYLVIASYRHHDDTRAIHNIEQSLYKLGIKVKHTVYYPQHHHFYHAYNGYYSSGYRDAIVIVMDGSGAWDKEYKYREIESIYTFTGNNVDELYKHRSNKLKPDSCVQGKEERFEGTTLYSNRFGCGMLFNNYCLITGLESGDNAGKLMGMSSYGNVTDQDEWTEIVGEHILFKDILYEQGAEKFKFIQEGGQYSFQEKANMAKKVQEETKEYTIEKIKWAIEKAPSKNIVLSGGYFLNCVNNYAYLKEFPDYNFYVDPIAWDGGTAIGAGYYIANKLGYNIKSLESIYLESE
jgi:carbamoyltransferase